MSLQPHRAASSGRPCIRWFAVLLVAAVVLTKPAATARARTERPLDPGLRALTLAAVGVVYLQIVFGAFLTHAGWLMLHLAGAAAVFVLVPIVTAQLRRAGDPGMRLVASVLLGLLVLQLGLGIGSYLSRFSPIWIPGGQTTMIVVPVVHRLVASLILAACVVLAVRAVRQGSLPWSGAPQVMGRMMEAPRGAGPPKSSSGPLRGTAGACSPIWWRSPSPASS